jgi:hypothetical protein
MSVPQIEATSTFRSTSPGPGCGTLRRSTRMSSASWSTTAVIVSGIAMELLSYGLGLLFANHSRYDLLAAYYSFCKNATNSRT